MGLTKERKIKLANKAKNNVLKILNTFKIDYYSLPKELQDAIRKVYIAGCTDIIEYLREEKELDEIPF